ncbi:MAG: His/Gly/Thr/Pro-type tRNA ligase C-terminal domain-containing protein, partial [Bacteroidota bacterium]
VDMTVAIDKLDKIGLDGVKKELSGRGFSDEAIATIAGLLENPSLEAIRPLIAPTEIGAKGVAEVDDVLAYLGGQGIHNEVKVDVTLARGLGYYTGCIFEVDCPSVKIGSIGGGGRYDDLTSNFGLKGVSGVGVSFGAARIYDVMTELELFPSTTQDSLQVLLVAFDEDSHRYAFGVTQSFRAAGINAELYPSPTKLKKQMKYANDRDVPYVVLIGGDEMASGQLSLKHMRTGEQERLSLEGITQLLQQ